MPSPEDLLRDMERDEEDVADLYRVERKEAPRKLVNAAEARKRYERDIKPVLEARARVAAGLPPTDNPLRNLLLRVTGRDTVEELPATEVVEPTPGIGKHVGLTEEEIRADMLAHPERYADRRKKAEGLFKEKK